MAGTLRAPGDSTVVCIGFMGAGKTTAATSIADTLGSTAVDVDRVIEEAAGNRSRGFSPRTASRPSAHVRSS